MRSLAITGFALLVAAFLGWSLQPFLNTPRDLPASITSPPPVTNLSLLEAPGGSRMCMNGIAIDRRAEVARFQVGTFHKPGPRLDVSFDATGYHFKHTIAAGWADNSVLQIAVPKPPHSQLLTVCIRNAGKVRIAYYSAGDQARSRAFVTLDGRKAGPSPVFGFWEARPVNLWDRLGTTVHRIGAFRGPLSGTWFIWATLTLFFLVVPALLGVVVWRAVGPRVGRRGRGRHAVLGAAVVTLAIVFTIPLLRTHGGDRLLAEPGTYTTLATRGFLDGHTYMELAVPPQVAHAKDPWNPSETGAARVNDAAYYKGHYYYAWGPVPPLLLVPWVWIGGRGPSDAFLSIASTLLALWPLALIIAFARNPSRRLGAAPRPSDVGWALLVLVTPPAVWTLGVGQVYEAVQGLGLLGIACMLLLAMGASRASLRTSTAALWGVGCGLSAFLAFGSRFSMVVPTAVVLAYMLSISIRRPSASLRAFTAAACAVVLVCGAGLALYNHARFGNFTETGWQYQTGSKEQIGLQGPRWDYLRANTPTFVYARPEIRPADWRAPDANSPTFGFGLYLLPLFVLALVAALLRRRRRALRADADDPRWFRDWTLLLLAAAVVTLIFTASATYASDFRYALDFVPLFALAAALLLRRGVTPLSPALRGGIALIAFLPSLVTAVVLWNRFPF